MRRQDFDDKSELRDAHERLLLAYKMAVEEGCVPDMIKAQREISRLFGFGREAPVAARLTTSQLQQQVTEMDLSIGGTS